MIGLSADSNQSNEKMVKRRSKTGWVGRHLMDKQQYPYASGVSENQDSSTACEQAIEQTEY